MECNSIRTNLSREDIISDIRLCIGADIYKENIYLILEGEDDIKFLRPFLSKDVHIYESYSGRSGVEYIVEECFENNTKVIGIIDRDYKTLSTSDKIFYYDYCCMEMMIFKSNYVFNKIYSEYYKCNYLVEELRMFILKELKYLSIIRMYNEKEKWEQKIKGVSINAAWDDNQKKIKKEIILEKINNINNNFFKNEVLEKIEQEYEREWDNEDFYNNTQGHDFSTMYAIVCNQYLNNNIKNTQIEASGRCTFSKSDFHKTNLYNKLLNYQNLNKCKILI